MGYHLNRLDEPVFMAVPKSFSSLSRVEEKGCLLNSSLSANARAISISMEASFFWKTARATHAYSTLVKNSTENPLKGKKVIDYGQEQEEQGQVRQGQRRATGGAELLYTKLK